MKKLIYIIASILLFTACSQETEIIDDGSEMPEVDPPSAEICRFQLTAEQTKLNIFDLTKLSIVDEKGNSLILGFGVLASSYDSIVWKVKGHNNALDEDYTFTTIANKQNQISTVDLHLMNTTNMEAPSFREKSEKELYNYMVQLYGKPTCEKDSEELSTKYNTFQIHEQEVTPLAYWLSSKTKVILLEKRIDSQPEYCYIHAEP